MTGAVTENNFRLTALPAISSALAKTAQRTMPATALFAASIVLATRSQVFTGASVWGDWAAR